MLVYFLPQAFWVHINILKKNHVTAINWHSVKTNAVISINQEVKKSAVLEYIHSVHVDVA